MGKNEATHLLPSAKFHSQGQHVLCGCQVEENSEQRAARVHKLGLKERCGGPIPVASRGQGAVEAGGCLFLLVQGSFLVFTTVKIS